MRLRVILDKEKIVKMLGSGATQREIAERFGVSTTSIYMFSRKNNIQNPNGKKLNIDREKLVAMRKSGMTLADIAVSFGVVPRTVSKVLKAQKKVK